MRDYGLHNAENARTLLGTDMKLFKGFELAKLKADGEKLPDKIWIEAASRKLNIYEVATARFREPAEGELATLLIRD